MKIRVFIVLFIVITSYIFSQNYNFDNIAGHYQWTDDRDTKVAINKQYILQKNLILFKDGTFVLFDSFENSENSSDIKYQPEIGGKYQIYNNLLFLIANDKLFIYKIEANNRLKGAITDYIYIRK